MRVMVIVKANSDTEAYRIPDPEAPAAMGRFNDELSAAGVVKVAEGLHPSSKGKRILFNGDKRTVVDGPFAETKELIAGFWLWEVASMDEAVEWAKRCPNPSGVEGQLEIRPIIEEAEFEELIGQRRR